MTSRWFTGALTLIWVVLATTLTAMGLSYYRIPMSERLYSPLHETFGPAGIVGQGMGIIGTLMILFGVLIYMLRKRVPWLGRFGSLGAWLQFHIFLCTLGPFLVLLHTTFKFGGIVSIAFWSMAIVVLSGVFGRYVYARIPKTLQGRFLDRSELQTRRDALVSQMASLAGQGPTIERLVPVSQQTDGGPALFRAVRFDVGRRSRIRAARTDLAARGVNESTIKSLLSMLGEERRVDLQIALMDPFQKLFRYWHAFHLPLAILMFVILGVHVAVAVAFGYTWIF